MSTAVAAETPPPPFVWSQVEAQPGTLASAHSSGSAFAQPGAHAVTQALGAGPLTGGAAGGGPCTALPCLPLAFHCPSSAFSLPVSLPPPCRSSRARPAVPDAVPDAVPEGRGLFGAILCLFAPQMLCTVRVITVECGWDWPGSETESGQPRAYSRAGQPLLFQECCFNNVVSTMLFQE